MNSRVRLLLNADADQQRRLAALQAVFAQACNALAPTARDTRCWNRVALHHMAYKPLRQQFPQLGSQMVCNVIYSVSRACREVYQHPASPFNLQRLGDRPLPLVQFSPMAPVFFDRHTLSIKAGEASLYTLDGRMRFQLALEAADERRFHEGRLLEVVLTRELNRFALTLSFGDTEKATDKATDAKTTRTADRGAAGATPGQTARMATGTVATASDRSLALADAGAVPAHLTVIPHPAAALPAAQAPTRQATP